MLILISTTGTRDMRQANNRKMMSLFKPSTTLDYQIEILQNEYFFAIEMHLTLIEYYIMLMLICFLFYGHFILRTLLRP